MKSESYNPLHTFSNFIVRPVNLFAYAVCMAVANRPDCTYNPVYIYGGAGTGKTHLLHAVGHKWRELYPSQKILYVTSEEFIAEGINLQQNETIPALKNKYDHSDMLLLDDIQFIIGKKIAQEEFAHILDSFINTNKQIIVTSDKSPRNIKEMGERLRLKFKGGIIADIAEAG